MNTGWFSTKDSIDVGLAVLSQVNRSGQQMTLEDIAEVCGCHRSRIEQIEKQALRKLRGRLSGHREAWL